MPRSRSNGVITKVPNCHSLPQMAGRSRFKMWRIKRCPSLGELRSFPWGSVPKG